MHSGHKRKPTNPAGNGTKPPAKKQATSSSTAIGHKWGEKGAQYIKGRWTKEESNKLKATIIEYARVNKIDVAILAQRKVKNARSGDENTSKQDWLSIANQSGITNRTLQSIYTHGCRVCDPNNYKGKWKPEEETKLAALVEQHGNKWGIIAESIGRERRGVQEKWNKLLGKAALRASSGSDKEGYSSMGGWTTEEETQLKALVKGHNDQKIEWPVTGIKWKQITAKFNKRSMAGIRKKWGLLWTTQHKWTSDEEGALCQAVSNCNAAAMNDVPWVRLRTAMGGNYPERAGSAYKVKYAKLMKVHLPKKGMAKLDPNTGQVVGTAPGIINQSALNFKKVVGLVAKDHPNTGGSVGNTASSSSSSSSSSMPIISAPIVSNVVVTGKKEVIAMNI